MTDRLLVNGYITRSTDPTSRRQNVLELTDKGRTLLSGIDEAWAAIDDVIRVALGEDAAAFFSLTLRLRDTLGGTVPDTRTVSGAAPDLAGTPALATASD